MKQCRAQGLGQGSAARPWTVWLLTLHTLTACEWQPGLLHRDRICKGFSTGLGTDNKSCLFFIFHLIFRWSTKVLTITASGIFQLTHFPKPPRNTLLATQSGWHCHFSPILCVGDFSTVSLPSLCPQRQHFIPLPFHSFLYLSSSLWALPEPPGESGACGGGAASHGVRREEKRSCTLSGRCSWSPL